MDQVEQNPISRISYDIIFQTIAAIDCQMWIWGKWGVCPDQCQNPLPKIESNRSIKTTAKHGGKPCPDKLSEEDVCEDPLPLKKKAVQDCQAGLTVEQGRNADLKKKLCNPNPCQNGGSCRDRTCTCNDGFTGSFCEEATGKQAWF